MKQPGKFSRLQKGMQMNILHNGIKIKHCVIKVKIWKIKYEYYLPFDNLMRKIV